MLTLYVMRHASSKSAKGGLSDKDRPLSFEGRGQLEDLCEKALGLFDSVSLVLVSSSIRTRQTFEGIKEILPLDREVHYLDSLYMAPVEAILEEIELLGDDHKAILLIGHNPAVSEFLSRVSGHTTLGALGTMGTSNIAVFDSEKDDWNGIRSGDFIFREMIR